MFQVVIVDDEDIIVTGLKKVVNWEQFGCCVAGTAPDAKTGALIIREIKPDILFTDIRMPGIDGLSMLTGLIAEFPNMQISVLTGHRDFEYAKRALHLGVTRYLLKPSKMSEIEEALQAMTDKLQQIAAKTTPEADNPKEPETDQNVASSFLVSSALEYIDIHFAQRLSLPDVADKIYVSQWYLSKLLNKHTGKSFYDLLNGTRIKHAKTLLHDPSLRIQDIADMVGFGDVAHFSRIFKKSEGVSPKEYRNNSI